VIIAAMFMTEVFSGHSGMDDFESKIIANSAEITALPARHNRPL